MAVQPGVSTTVVIDALIEENPTISSVWGIVMLVNLVHSSKAFLTILVTEFGMVMLVKLLHLEKAANPMLESLESGLMVMLLKILHSEKAV